MIGSVDFDVTKDVMKDLHDKIDADLMVFLNRCLVFNPEHRSSIDSLLADPIFEHIRCKEYEVTETRQVVVTVDHLPVNPYTGEKEDYSTKKMKNYIVKLLKKVSGS